MNDDLTRTEWSRRAGATGGGVSSLGYPAELEPMGLPWSPDRWSPGVLRLQWRRWISVLGWVALGAGAVLVYPLLARRKVI